MKQIDVILEKVNELVASQSKHQLIGVNAFDLSIDLKMDRANVSKILNELWKNNKLIKINGRPTQFLPISLIVNRFPNYRLETYYDSYDAFIQSITIEINSKPLEIEYPLSITQEKVLMDLTFPLGGYSPLVVFEHGFNNYDFIYQIYVYSMKNAHFHKNTNFIFIDCAINKHVFFALFETPKPTLKPAFIFIDNIHLLSSSEFIQLEQILSFIKNQTTAIYSSLKIVLGIQSSRLEKIPSQISHTIHIRPFNELPMFEKLQHIIETIKSISKKIHFPVRIQKDIFKTLCINLIDTNYFIIEKNISNAIIHSYYRSTKEGRQYCELLWSDFSFPLIHKNIPKHTPINIIDSYFDDVIQFDEDGKTKLDYIYNQPIVQELLSLISKTSFLTKKAVNEFLYQYCNKIKHSNPPELYSLIINSSFSKLSLYKINDNKESIGLDFLTSNLNIVPKKDISAEMLDYLLSSYPAYFRKSETQNIGLILLIDSRHEINTYKKILDNSTIHAVIHALHSPLSLVELKDIFNSFLPINQFVIITDLRIYKNIDSLIQKEVDYDILSYFPLSIPIVEELVSKLETSISFNELRKERFEMSHSIQDNVEEKEEIEFLNNLTEKFLYPSLTFLDAHKAIKILYPSLSNILKYLKLPHSKEFMVKYLVHCAFLIERCIRQESLDHKNLTKIIRENSDLFYFIKKELKIVEQAFGINITLPEIAFIVEIFIT